MHWHDLEVMPMHLIPTVGSFPLLAAEKKTFLPGTGQESFFCDDHIRTTSWRKTCPVLLNGKAQPGYLSAM
jgi:hypothetical protein